MDFTKVPMTLRIATHWSTLSEMLDALPAGFAVEPIAEGPDAGGFRWQIDHTPNMDDQQCGWDAPLRSSGVFFCRNADDQFANIVRTMARGPLHPDEDTQLQNYQMQVCLTGHGGSQPRAAAMVIAANIISRPGGSALFCDNSGVSFGAEEWHQMAVALAEGIDIPEVLTFALVGIVGGVKGARTTGMQMLGLPDLQLPFSEGEADGDRLIDCMRYVAATDRDFTDGHLIINPVEGTALEARFVAVDDRDAPSMSNPWGRLELTPQPSEGL